MKKHTRWLAWLLLLAMVASLGFTAAFANEETEDEQPVETEGNAVTEIIEELEESPAAEIPAEEVPAEETPAEETPAEETPAEETPAEETPAEETPAEETPAEETPVEEILTAEPEPVPTPAPVPDTITAQPQSISVVAGELAAFSVEGSSAIRSCQWQYSKNGRSWTNLSTWLYGSGTTLSFTSSRSDNNYQFRVVVTFRDGKKATSDAAVLTVVSPYISAQPRNVTALSGTAKFTVGVEGSVSYVTWQYSRNGRSWTNLSSWTYGSGTTLNFPVKKSYDGYYFRANVVCWDGTRLTSDAAKLTYGDPLAGNITVDGEKVSVAVKDPGGALPYGAELKIEPADANASMDEVDRVVDGEIKDMVALDIGFNTGNPNGDVTVTVQSDAIREMAAAGYTLKLVHIREDGTAETIENAVFGDGTVTFTNDEFSPYIIVGVAVIENEEDTLTFETDEYIIKVTYTKDAKIPVGTELVVSQIPYGSDEYWNLWEQTLAKLNENATHGSEVEPSTYRGLASAAFFDITLNYNGKPFEPDVPLQVEISFNYGGLPLFDGQEAEVIHFGQAKTRGADGTELIGGDDLELGMAGALADGMPDGVAVDSFTYDQLGFSIVGVVTTDEYIDFESAEYVESLGDISTLASTMLRAAPMKAAGGDPTINAGKTVSDTNGDGIYELELSVNATAQITDSVTKSNVVMVIDVSGSMGTNWIYYDTYTYDAGTYDDFRYYTSSSSTNTQLYYGQYRTGGYGSTVYTGWYSGGQTYGGNVYNATAYSGTVYAYETRLHATQRAACAVVDALLAKNTETGIEDLFEITVIQFANKTEGNFRGVDCHGTETVIQDSTSPTAVKNAINGLTAAGGTNWDAALQQALAEANYFKNQDESQLHDPEENTSVIFLTDGFPTLYGDDTGDYLSGTFMGWGDYDYRGQEIDSNIDLCYTGARDAARSIKSNGYTLYNIFAFGSDTTTHNDHTGFAYLRALTNYAYGSGNTDNYNETDITRQYAFNAKSTDDLVAAFEKIVSHITNSVGYAGVNLTDGVSLGATSTSVAVNGTAKADSMRYTVKDDTGKLSYTVTFDDGTATFTIYNEGGTTTTLTDDTPDKVTTEIDPANPIESDVYSVTVGTGSNAKTYKMSPAKIDASTGMVTWDLAGLGILESGYTYTVSFDVWPKQVTYDICADLNNGIYTTVDGALDAYGVTDTEERQHIKDALVHNADGSYSLYTNYSQDVTYYPATEVEDDEGVHWSYGDKTTQELPQPSPIPLQGSSLPLAKVWESDLALTELNELLWEDGVVGGESKEYQITLYIWKAETEAELDEMVHTGITEENQPYITKTLGWDSDTSSYIFEKDVAVAPGMMVNLDEAEELGFDITDTSKLRTFTNDQGTTLTYYVVEEGHYFYVTEDGSDLHFELETVLYHPMIVDGTLYNVFFGEGQTVIKMDPMYAVVATNYLKGGLNIRKVVSSTQIVKDDEFVAVQVPVYDNHGKPVTDPDTGEQATTEGLDIKNCTPVEDCEVEFSYKITIWQEDEEGNVSPVYTYDDQYKTDNISGSSGCIGYREFGKVTNSPNPGDREVLGRDVIVIEGTENASERLAANWKSVSANSTHTPVYAHIEDSKTVIILSMPAYGEIRIVNLPRDTYYTVEEIVDPDDEVYNFGATKSEIKYNEQTIAYKDAGTTNGVSGSIIGNTASLETFYNWTTSYFYVYHSSNNMIERISFADNRVKGTYDSENEEYVYTFNIMNEVGRQTDGTMEDLYYGGYYRNYGGKAETTTDAMINGTAESGKFTYVEATNGGTGEEKVSYGFWAEDEGGTEYDQEIAYTNKWTFSIVSNNSKAYTEKGSAMHPVADTVYYLKEVPNDYLTPYVQFVYNLGTADTDPWAIKNIYLITDVDDNMYRQGGYGYIVSSDSTLYKSARVCKQFDIIQVYEDSVETEGDDIYIVPMEKTTTITPNTVNGKIGATQGLVAVVTATSWMNEENKDYTVTPFWRTPDNEYVTGQTIKLYTGDLTATASGVAKYATVDATTSTPIFTFGSDENNG